MNSYQALSAYYDRFTGDVGYVGTIKLGSHFTEQLRALK